ncbi:hypothetical protein ACROSR_18875 [Roseovarius tibetensis]|uniref:hypothetical protein n=1 Tax=Roseovarius tibetensis TaxID=2685897 RepID=UPI003D7F1D8B
MYVKNCTRFIRISEKTGIRVPFVNMKNGYGISVWCGFVGFAMLGSVSASASTVTVIDPGTRRGGPVSQTFLENQGENVSLVRTQHGISCVASRVLPIADASYSAPDGTPVSFEDVTRSPASSVQAIAHPDEPVTFRVQLKYSPDPSRPIEMRIDGQTLDLVDALEPSSDSLLLTGDTAQLLANEMRRGTALTLRATSDATGRQITDRLMAPDMAGLDSCLVTLEDLPSVDDRPTAEVSNYDVADADIPGLAMEFRDGDERVAVTSDEDVLENVGTMPAEEAAAAQPVVPVPVTGLRLEFTARPDPELRIDPSALKHCRMRDIPDDVFLGQLRSVTGFFSQTQDVYVAFDDRGELQRAYIPGIFDSDLTAGTNRSRISLAADSNLPDQPNTVRGCLGDAPLQAPVCAISKSGDDGYTVAECGVLGMSQTLDEYLEEMLLPFFAGPDEAIPAMTTARERAGDDTSFSRSVDSSSSFRSSSGPVGNGGLSSPVNPSDLGSDIIVSGGSSTDTGEGGRDVPMVPLPAAFWMMLLALTGLSGVSVLKHCKKHL